MSVSPPDYQSMPWYIAIGIDLCRVWRVKDRDLPKKIKRIQFKFINGYLAYLS